MMAAVTAPAAGRAWQLKWQSSFFLDEFKEFRASRLGGFKILRV
jgi:hypothetical protein